MRTCKGLCRELTLFFLGGMVYVVIEVLWRGQSHWSMFLLGGALFVLLGRMNEGVAWDTPLPIQALWGALAVTAAEFLAGCVLNLWLGLDVWDYTDLPLNLWGQVCVPYALLWVPLSAVAVVLDDWLRYWLWGGMRPHYHLIGSCKT